MKTKETLVLGGGANGLISAYFTRGTLVSPELSMPKGPIYLYQSVATNRFLEDLYIGKTEKKINIGFLKENGSLVDTVTKEEWKNYEIKTGRTRKIPETFEYYEFDWRELIIKLTKNIDMVQDEITGVDPDNKIAYGKKREYVYDTLISTIPAPIFSKLVGEKVELEGTPIRFKNWKLEMGEYRKHHYIYDLSPHTTRLRITPHHYYQLEEHLGQPANAYKIRGGKPVEYENIKYIGRMARWDPNCFIDREIGLLYKER